MLAEISDVDRAVQAAAAAFEGWSESSLSRCTGVLFAFREIINRRKAELAVVITDEHCKVLSDAAGEVQRGLEVVEFACGIPQLLKGEYFDQVFTAVDSYGFRQPLGVVAGVTPFDFPVTVAMWMSPWRSPAATPSSSSERDPSASMLLAEMWVEAGLPPRVSSTSSTATKIAVDALLDPLEVAAVSFVGSTPIARYVHERGIRNGKRVQALGGAKNHAIVLPDADLEFASDHLVAAYGSAGERCMAISATIAVGWVGDDLIEILDRRSRAVRVGPGRDPASDMGPIVTRASPDQRQPVRQRHRDLHLPRRPGPQVRPRRQGRHDRRQRAGAGPDGLRLLRRPEGLAVWRAPRARPGRRRFYTRAKVLTQRWPELESDASFDMPTAR